MKKEDFRSPRKIFFLQSVTKLKKNTKETFKYIFMQINTPPLLTVDITFYFFPAICQSKLLWKRSNYDLSK